MRGLFGPYGRGRGSWKVIHQLSFPSVWKIIYVTSTLFNHTLSYDPPLLLASWNVYRGVWNPISTILAFSYYHLSLCYSLAPSSINPNTIALISLAHVVSPFLRYPWVQVLPESYWLLLSQSILSSTCHCCQEEGRMRLGWVWIEREAHWESPISRCRSLSPKMSR